MPRSITIGRVGIDLVTHRSTPDDRRLQSIDTRTDNRYPVPMKTALPEEQTTQNPKPRGFLERRKAVYIVFLALLSAVPPLATDMYLGAMPIIARQWHVGENVVGLSLVLWFATFSVSLLICGPLSDKFGRRPVLMIGLCVFMAASFLCATSANVWQLIAYRILQGAGAAAPSSMCLAICRDRYDGERRKRALAYIGTILAVAPMVAPSIGVTLQKMGSWRYIFLMQGSLALMTILISMGYRETIAARASGTVLHVMSRYKNLFTNRSFVLATTSMGLIAGPHFGFIAFSPIAYIKVFALGPRAFSLLFGANAIVSMLGAFTCTRLTRRIADTLLISVCFAGCAVGTLGVLFFGSMHYLTFAGWMGIFTFCCGMSRPLANNIMLSRVNSDIGSASSLIVFYQFIIGAISMAIATAAWGKPVMAFGALASAYACAVLIMWPFLQKMLRAQDKSQSDL